MLERWTRYWSPPGGRIAAGVVRIALAISALIVLAHAIDSPFIYAPGTVDPHVYHPIGVLMVFRAPPPAIVITLAWHVGRVAAVAMLLGLGSRLAGALTTLCTLIISAQIMSYQAGWSHDLNVVQLALIAFLGARGGDAIALDRVIARWRGRPVPEAAHYQWSLRLVQLAVGLMFVSACTAKLATGGVHWALSDNLRHQILVRYDLLNNAARPAIVDWILERSWRYQGAACLNLISQAAPLAAILFARRPWIRALGGMFFVIEVAALAVVMQLSNPSWFPLAAVFVDWDRLWAFVRRAPLPEAAAPSAPLSRPVLWFIAAFVTVDLLTSFVPRLDRRLRTFPFSQFPMFSNVRAKRPYADHQSYEVVAGRVELIADQPVPPDIQVAINRYYSYRSLPSETNGEALHHRCVTALAELRERYPALGVHGVRVLATVFQVAPYPAPAQFDRIDLGVLGELREGAWVSYLHELPTRGTSFGPLPAGATATLFRNGLAAPARTTGDQIAFPDDRSVIDVVAPMPGADGQPRPFVLARRAGHTEVL
ncbi:MAG TPA: hypothetical protein VFP84_29040 [Kofleriaceae bacterium]|nr:hypothetical protein [Kofleriaceae bacterium]